MKKKKNERNAGRKPLYNEPTKTVGFKVPISKIEGFKKEVSEILKKYISK